LAQFLIFASKTNKMRILFVLFILLSIKSFGQDTKAQGILDKLSSKIKSQKSFYVEFSANIRNNASGANESETGKGWVKGEKYYASYGENTIISNGIKTWTIVKEDKSVYETDANEDDSESMNPKKLMTIWETGFKNKYEKEDKLNNESVHVIDLYPKNAGKAPYHTIILYISKANNDLKKAIMKAKDGTVSTYSLTKFTSNTPVEDTKFVFDMKKYPGYTLVKD
jgi:outer membrane lipoprotein-sorting protein